MVCLLGQETRPVARVRRRPRLRSLRRKQRRGRRDRLHRGSRLRHLPQFCVAFPRPFGNRGQGSGGLAERGPGTAAHDCRDDEHLVFVHGPAAAPGAWWNPRSCRRRPLGEAGCRRGPRDRPDQVGAAGQRFRGNARRNCVGRFRGNVPGGRPGRWWPTCSTGTDTRTSRPGGGTSTSAHQLSSKQAHPIPSLSERLINQASARWPRRGSVARPEMAVCGAEQMPGAGLMILIL